MEDGWIVWAWGGCWGRGGPNAPTPLPLLIGAVIYLWPCLLICSFLPLFEHTQDSPLLKKIATTSGNPCLLISPLPLFSQTSQKSSRVSLVPHPLCPSVPQRISLRWFPPLLYSDGSRQAPCDIHVVESSKHLMFYFTSLSSVWLPCPLPSQNLDFLDSTLSQVFSCISFWGGHSFFLFAVWIFFSLMPALWASSGLSPGLLLFLLHTLSLDWSHRCSCLQLRFVLWRLPNLTSAQMFSELLTCISSCLFDIICWCCEVTSYSVCPKLADALFPSPPGH